MMGFREVRDNQSRLSARSGRQADDVDIRGEQRCHVKGTGDGGGGDPSKGNEELMTSKKKEGAYEEEEDEEKAAASR